MSPNISKPCRETGAPEGGQGHGHRVGESGEQGGWRTREQCLLAGNQNHQEVKETKTQESSKEQTTGFPITCVCSKQSSQPRYAYSGVPTCAQVLPSWPGWSRQVPFAPRPLWLTPLCCPAGLLLCMMVEVRVSPRVHLTALTRVSVQFNFWRCCSAVPSILGWHRETLVFGGWLQGQLYNLQNENTQFSQWGGEISLPFPFPWPQPHSRQVTHKSPRDCILCAGSYSCLIGGE